MSKQIQRLRRAHRNHVKARVTGRVRLLVYKSNVAIYASIIDDSTGKIICGTSNLKEKSNSIETAKKVGEAIAKLALEKNIKEVSFDRNGFAYHGKIAALADGARENGLSF